MKGCGLKTTGRGVREWNKIEAVFEIIIQFSDFLHTSLLLAWSSVLLTVCYWLLCLLLQGS